ncbi:hypothetical protein MHB40_14845 [Lysinibacillus sp. FSL K6-0057]|uniref:hypothetical protein n=1 Tax=Lysinibacillus sp. FSL K6-0057 TaxID=2921411 RepID=UPI003159C3FC
MNKINNILTFDTFLESERIIGKSYNEFDADEQLLSLAFHAKHNETKREILKDNNDTYFSMEWNEFKSLMKWNGFNVGLSYKFGNEGNENEAILFYNNDGIVIWSTSYFESLNEAKLYAQIKFEGEINYVTKTNKFWKKTYQELVMTPELLKAKESLNGFSHDAFMNIGKGIHISLDCREGMFYRLDKIKKQFTFYKEWNSSPFLWLLDFAETKNDTYDRKEINREKILKCTPDAQKIMLVELSS